MTTVALVHLTPGCDGTRPQGEDSPSAPAVLSCGEFNMLPRETASSTASSAAPAVLSCGEFSSEFNDDEGGSGPACHAIPCPALHHRRAHDPGPPPGLLSPGGGEGSARGASQSAGCPEKTGIESRRTPLSRAARAYVPKVLTAVPEATIGTRGKSRQARMLAATSRAQPDTTVMMRNLPYCYTRQRLIDLLNSKGFSGKYDFLYLPFDFESRYHVGYAFVNLTAPEHATRFIEVFSGFNDWTPRREHRICEVSWGLIQGLRANFERFESRQMQIERFPDEWKPALFIDGVQTSVSVNCSVDTKRMSKGPGIAWCD